MHTTRSDQDAFAGREPASDRFRHNRWFRPSTGWDDRLLRLLTPHRLRSLSAVWRCGLALLFVVAATALRWALIPWLGTEVPHSIAIPAVVATTVLLGTGPGLLSMVLLIIGDEGVILGSFPTIWTGATLARLDTSLAAGGVMVGVLHALRVAALKAQQSAARLAAFATATFEGVVESRDGWIADCNEQFAQMMGCTVAELQGVAIADLIAPEDRERVAANIRENRESVMEHAALRKDGTRIVVETHGRPAAPSSPHRYTAIRDVTERKEAEEARRESEERLRLALTATNLGTWDYNPVTGVLVWDARCKELFGLPPEAEVNYDTFLAGLHPEDRERANQVVERTFDPTSGGLFDIEYRTVGLRGGALRWVRATGRASFNDAGQTVRFIGTVQDITARKQADEALKASLNEKEVLLKEIHHRVKNNMQVISSLVGLQADQLQDEAMRAVLQDVAHRVRSMALVHEKLYQSTDMARVEFAEYAQSLLNYLWRAHGTAAGGIRLALDLEPVPLSVNAAVPCGLILNELATNALKHAFPKRKREGEREKDFGCEVRVTLCADSEGRACLRVRDNGTGLPAGLDWRQADSLGLRLVQVLAKQLDATVEVQSGEGTEFSVRFGGPNP